jgi:hypothetical protein
MMQLKTFDVFTKKAQEHYDTLVKTILVDAKTITSTALTPVEIQDFQLKIFNKVYKYPLVDILNERPDFRTGDIDIDTASNLIGNGFSFGTSSNKTPITQVDYFINYAGTNDALALTVNFNKRSFRGNVLYDMINLQYHFQNSDSKIIGPLAKEQKNNFIHLLETNKQEVESFFAEKKNSFLLKIKHTIEDKIAENKKRIEDLGDF